MFRAAALSSLLLAGVAYAQQFGTFTAETHPSLPAQQCTTSGGCETISTTVVLDSNWRWLHSTSGDTNCYTGNSWNVTLCPDAATCVANCALDGADYSGTYGITTTGNALTLRFVTGSNVGSRVYLMANDSAYHMFKLLNQEFTFDVDVSNLPCGVNGAAYLVEMDADGGMAKYPTNKAGAKYGTGYCDAQCPRDIKFINGLANVNGWQASLNDANAGTGNWGTCCNEMDIWEANSNAAVYTPHSCSVSGQTRCTGTDCGQGDDRYAGVCDADGCDFNSYRMGNTSFLGKGLTVDTTRKITVVTQFITSDGTSSGSLSEIRRLYIQNGKVIQNSNTSITGIDPVNSITDNFCAQQKSAFGDQNYFASKGGLKTLGSALSTGMVLALSIWDDHTSDMLWLDSTYPPSESPTAPGVTRGPCIASSGEPIVIESVSGSASVTYSNIKFGDIGSTYTSGTTTAGSVGGGGSS
ncbi:glycoside hydrolase family 7 protein, partial [Auriscalpium vulgare]